MVGLGQIQHSCTFENGSGKEKIISKLAIGMVFSLVDTHDLFKKNKWLMIILRLLTFFTLAILIFISFTFAIYESSDLQLEHEK